VNNAGIYADTRELDTNGFEMTIYLTTFPKVAHVTGKYFVRCREQTPASKASGRHLALRLWET